MENNEGPVSILTDDECWGRLASQRVGRLVTSVGGVADIVPINFVVDSGGIVFRTASGSKLAGLTINSEVVFEVDEFTEDEGWSVVLRGHARALEHDADIVAAEKLPLRPFVPTVKRTFVRIDVDTLTGRAFKFGPDPLPEYS